MEQGGTTVPTIRRRARVYVVDGRVFVYDATSVAILLSEHRIWATPVGIRRARNKSPEHNLPCVLSQEQATLVLRKNLAHVEYRCSTGGGHGHLHLRPHHPVEGSGGTGQTVEQEAMKEKNSTTSHPGSGLGFDWKFPETPAEMKSMAVFEDLWARGLCAVSGSNYGADYVVYDGPPTEHHSIAAVAIGRGSNDELSPAEVSGFARMQQAVGKRAVLAVAPLTREDTVAAAGTLGQEEAEPTEMMSGEAAASQERGKAVVPGKGEVAEATTTAEAANERVRYVTLQFHSVGSRT